MITDVNILKQMIAEKPSVIRTEHNLFENCAPDGYKELALYAIALESTSEAATQPQKSTNQEIHDSLRSEQKKDEIRHTDYQKLAYDELGNLKIAYEIARYEKDANNKWIESNRYDTLHGRWSVVDGKIYHLYGDTLSPMNMDFTSPYYGACERIVGIIPITHKLTKIAKLGTVVKSVESKISKTPITSMYTLTVYHYNDSEPVFYLVSNYTQHSWCDTDNDKLIERVRDDSEFSESPEFVDEVEQRIMTYIGDSQVNS